jgi:integrase
MRLALSLNRAAQRSIVWSCELSLFQCPVPKCSNDRIGKESGTDIVFREHWNKRHRADLRRRAFHRQIEGCLQDRELTIDRCRRCVLGLTLRQVDLADRTVRLEAGTTKNGRGRIVSLTEECFTLLQACCLGKKQDDHVLTRDHGKRVLDFRGAWQGACVRAELGKFVCRDCEEEVTKKKCKCGSLRRKYVGLLFHDLRRTAVRNLRRLGVAESVAMKISGHKTASVFRRYDIVEMADLADAAARLDTKQKSNASVEVPFGQSSDRVAKNSTKTGAAADSIMSTPVLLN